MMMEMRMGQMMMGQMMMGMGQRNMTMNMDTVTRSAPVAVGVSHTATNDYGNRNMDIRWKKLLQQLNHE